MELNNIDLRGQLALAQSQLARVITDNTQAIEHVRAQALDLDDRLKASIALEREALVRSSQQATSSASTEARYQQQLALLKHTMCASERLCATFVGRRPTSSL